MNQVITFDKEKAIKLLSVLEKSIPKKDFSQEERGKIYESMYEFMLELEEHFNLSEGHIE